MSTVVAERRVDVVQAGLGPGGAAFWLTVDRLRERGDPRVEIFAKSNVAVFERSAPNHIGVGYLEKFPGVKTNSDGHDLTANLSNAAKEALLRTEIGRKNQAEGRGPVSLRDAVELQREKGAFIRGMLGDQLVTGVEVGRFVQARQRGGDVYFILDKKGRSIAQTDIVLSSVGARERLDPELDNDAFREKTILSEGILGTGPEVEANRARLAKARKIVMVGVNHSNGLVLQDALDSSQAHITLVTRRPLAVHSKSIGEAIAAGLTVTPEALADDPEGRQPWRIRGARGKAGEAIKAIMLGEHRDRVTYIIGSYGDISPRLQESDLIIQGTGLKANKVSIYLDDGTPVDYKMMDERIVINPDGNPYVATSDGVYGPAEQIFHIGMGSFCEEAPEANAINFYEGSVGERRVLAVARALERVHSVSQARQALMIR